MGLGLPSCVGVLGICEVHLGVRHGVGVDDDIGGGQGCQVWECSAFGPGDGEGGAWGTSRERRWCCALRVGGRCWGQRHVGGCVMMEVGVRISEDEGAISACASGFMSELCSVPGRVARA